VQRAWCPVAVLELLAGAAWASVVAGFPYQRCSSSPDCCRASKSEEKVIPATPPFVNVNPPEHCL
jgi:hypothetical protein